MAERKAFNFFKSYYDVFKELDKKNKLIFIEALLDRQFTGTEPTGLEGMANFAYISQKHNIDSQVKGFEDKTGEKLTPTIGGSSAPTVQEKGKVQVIEKEEVIEEYTKVFSFKESLITYGFKKELVEDWLKVRAKKKGVNTETAFNGFIKKIEKREGVDINELLAFIIEKNWLTFEWSWIDKEKPEKQSNTARVLKLHEEVNKQLGID